MNLTDEERKLATKIADIDDWQSYDINFAEPVKRQEIVKASDIDTLEKMRNISQKLDEMHGLTLKLQRIELEKAIDNYKKQNKTAIFSSSFIPGYDDHGQITSEEMALAEMIANSDKKTHEYSESDDKDMKLADAIVNS